MFPLWVVVSVSCLYTWQDSGRFKSNSLFFESFALEPLAWLCFILLFFSAHSVWNVKNIFINPRSNSLKKQLRWRQRLKEGPALFGPPMVQKAPKGFLEFSVTRHGCCLFFHLNISDSLVLQQSRSSDSDAGNYSWRKQWFIIPPLFFVVLSSDKEIPFVPCPTSIGFLCGFSPSS